MGIFLSCGYRQFGFDLFDLAGLQFEGEIGFSFWLLASCPKKAGLGADEKVQ